MSRVGKMPIPVPKGTTVEVKDGVFTAKGPKGEVSQTLLPGFPVAIEDGAVQVRRESEAASSRARHGLLRALLANAVKGVSEGFTKDLEIVGVGYRAEVKGREIHLALGYSHPVVYPVPEGIQVEVDTRANKVKVSGADRQKVGQVAADIRNLRRPDPYKGKGIKYANEILRRKVGKAGAR